MPAFSHPLALGAGGDAHFLAVFGDGAAGAIYALLFEQFGDLAVGQGVGGVFAFDELADEGAHGGGLKAGPRLASANVATKLPAI